MGFSLAAFAYAAFFLAVGLMIVWTVSLYMKPIESATAITLILLPFFVYLIFTDRMHIFKVAGIEATFQKEARTAVEKSAITQSLSAEDRERLAAAAENLVTESFFEQPREILTVDASKWKALEPDLRLTDALRVGHVIYTSLLAGSFKALVILDERGRTLGLFERDAFLDLLRLNYTMYGVSGPDLTLEEQRAELRRMFQKTELWVILKNPEVRAQNAGSKAAISGRETRAGALKTMTANGWHAAMVTADDGAYAGLLWRPYLVETLLLGALGEEKKTADGEDK